MCNGVGSVKNISGFLTCECEAGFSLNDCKGKVGDLPPITQVITPVHQYTDKDDYRNNNPIFNNTVFAQLHLTMPPEFLTYNLEPANRESSTYLVSDIFFITSENIRNKLTNQNQSFTFLHL